MLAVSTNAPPYLGRTSFKVYQALAKFTAFPWPIMKSQCRRRGLDPAELSATQLGFVLQDLALAVARFNDMNTGFAARRALVDVLRQVTAGPAPAKIEIDSDSAA